MPREDSDCFSDTIFAVADGVTRDPIFPKGFKSKNIRDILKYYPRPSGAYTVARIFTNKFLDFSKKTEDISDIFSKINRLIANFNKRRIQSMNYLENDYFGCVVCGGYIKDNTLFYGCIGDCGLTIYNSQGKIKFKTKNGLKKFINYEKKFLKKENFNWMMSKYRYLIRSEYRNTEKLYKNQIISYGVLTGEEKALGFVEYGEKKLEKGDIIIFYSDGFSPLVNSKKFSQLIYDLPKNIIRDQIISTSLKLARKDYEKFGHERSLIIKFL